MIVTKKQMDIIDNLSDGDREVLRGVADGIYKVGFMNCAKLCITGGIIGTAVTVIAYKYKIVDKKYPEKK